MEKISCTKIIKRIFLLLVLIPLTWTFSCKPINKETLKDCYYYKKGSLVILGNSKIEVEINASNGVITQMKNKESGHEFQKKGMKEIFGFEYCTWELHGAEEGDLWTASNGTPVKSSLQKVSSMKFSHSDSLCTLVISYDSICLERRKLNISLSYSVNIKPLDDEIKLNASINNNDRGTIREFQFPIISCLSDRKWLLMPNHTGQRLTDPLNKLNDEVPVLSIEYPGRASMQWFDYYSKDAGIYMASEDKRLEYTRLCFGRYNDDKSASIWIVKYPFLTGKNKWESPDFSIALHSGDWHGGADRYSAWLRTWIKSPDVPAQIREMTGNRGGIYIKNMKMEPVTTYSALPDAVKRFPPGANIMLIGWFRDGHDTYYPEYVPIPEMGGEDALVKAIDRIHREGKKVNAYLNLRLANIETDTYRKNGRKWALLSRGPGYGVGKIELLELLENWNDEWSLAKKGEGYFSVMCPFVKEWQDHITGEATRIIGRYHFDGIFLDQPGSYYGELCYNKYHGHSTPANAWGPGYLRLIKRIHYETRQINPESFLWEEGVNDAYGQYLDYHLDKNPVWEPMRSHPEMESFPEMFRYVLPEYVIINSPNAYSFLPSKDKIYGENYKYVMGIRGLAASGNDKQKEVLNKIEKLWKMGNRYFFYGKFLDDIGLSAGDSNLFCKVYTSDNSVAIPYWNTSGNPVNSFIEINLKTVPGINYNNTNQVTDLETGNPLPCKSHDGKLTINISCPPNSIGAVIINE
ncbi:MAG: DUF6259 domain-containing protein [Bacteroidales bacterium]